VIVIVTGASSGIGAAVAKVFVKAGHTVIGISRDAQKLESLARALGGKFEARPCDVTDTTVFAAVLRQAADDHGRIDVLVNNAGTAKAIPIADTTPDEFRDMHELNVVAPAAAIHALWPSLRSHGDARIINVSSLAQLDPFPGFFAYASSKAALHLLTVVTNAEGEPHGIRAFTLAPGVVDTPLHRSLMPDSIPPVDGLASALQSSDVAKVILEIAEGKRDDRAGWVLAMPAPAAVASLRRWVIEHPGGGVEILS
jgi:NAD(P)-dependent dehydrogenase (short-subunit alcohol dehydrogenase family)